MPGLAEHLAAAAVGQAGGEDSGNPLVAVVGLDLRPPLDSGAATLVDRLAEAQVDTPRGARRAPPVLSDLLRPDMRLAKRAGVVARVRREQRRRGVRITLDPRAAVGV